MTAAEGSHFRRARRRGRQGMTSLRFIMNDRRCTQPSPRRVSGNAGDASQTRTGATSVRRGAGLCQTVLDLLVDAKFLRVSADGRYARVTDGEMSSRRSARARRRGIDRLSPRSSRGSDGIKGLNMTRFAAALAASVLLATNVSLHAQPQSPPVSGDGAADLARIDRLEAQLAAQQAQIDQLRKLLAAQPQPLAAPVSVPDIASTPNTAGARQPGSERGAREACGSEVQDRHG